MLSYYVDIPQKLAQRIRCYTGVIFSEKDPSSIPIPSVILATYYQSQYNAPTGILEKCMIFFYNSNHFNFYILNAPLIWNLMPTLAKCSEFPDLKIFRISDIPNFLFYDFPLLQLSDFPNFRISTYQYLIFSDFPNFWFSDFPTFRFSEFRGFKKINGHEKKNGGI